MSQIEPMGVRPLARGALSEQIVEQVSGWILTGQASPGEMLPPERELAARFGVSKAAVREAGKVLAAKGLVTIRQGEGTSVNSSDQWNVLDPHIVMHTGPNATFDDLLVVRRMLEPAICAMAALQANDKTLEYLRMAVDRGCHAADAQEHARWDMEFHELLALATGNPVMLILVKSVSQLLRTSRETLFQVPGSLERSCRHHTEIYEAIASRDSERSRAGMLAHLQQVADDIALWQQTAPRTNPT